MSDDRLASLMKNHGKLYLKLAELDCKSMRIETQIEMRGECEKRSGLLKVMAGHRERIAHDLQVALDLVNTELERMVK